MSDTLDIAIIDANTLLPPAAGAAGDAPPAALPKIPAIVLARRGSDIAVAGLPFDADLKALTDFRDLVDQALHGIKESPPNDELTKFGNSIFKYIIRDQVQRLYENVPSNGMVRVSIMINSDDLKSLPWEFLQDTNQAPGPWLDRSVVRVVPTIKVEPLEPLVLANLGRKLRILFAYADPDDQYPVDWPEIKASVERALSPSIPKDSYELELIEANPKDLTLALQAGPCDIFHFCGHGVVQDKEGYIILLEPKTNKSILYNAKNLSMVLRSRGIRLVILSACYTSAGKSQNSNEKFSITAEALVNSGIPAVVANQFAVPDSTVATFVRPLYAELLRTGDIDKAVSEARILLATDPALSQGGKAPLEWGIPTLYRHVAGAQIFKPQ